MIYISDHFKEIKGFKPPDRYKLVQWFTVKSIIIFRLKFIFGSGHYSNMVVGNGIFMEHGIFISTGRI